MDVKYTSGPAARIVNGVGRVERGQTVKVPDEQGRKMIRGIWEQVRSVPKPPTKTTTTTGPTTEPAEKKE